MIYIATHEIVPDRNIAQKVQFKYIVEMDDADKEEDIHIPTFVEEDVDNYVEQVGKQVISVHEQVCKSNESLYVLQGFYKLM